MHMKTRKRFLALVAAAAMVLAPCVAFADSVTSPAIGGGTGDGKVEGVVDKEVFTVVLPTVTDQLDFILDPQKVISASKTATSPNPAYSTATFDDGTLFFKTAENTYGKSSADLTITSKSSIPVDVKVEVSATGDAIGFATDESFSASGDKAEIYMAIEGGTKDPITSNAIYVDPETKKATVTKQLEAVDEGKFQIKYEGGKYVYKLKDDAGDADFKSTSFKLTGASNSNGNWLGLEDIKPAVDVVWTVTAVTSMQKISSASDTIAWTDRESAYTFKVDAVALGGTSVADVGVYSNKKTFDYNSTWNAGQLKTVGLVVLEGDTITLNPTVSTYLPSGSTLYIRLNSAEGYKTVEIKMQ